MTRRTVEQVLSYLDNTTGETVVVAGDVQSISALVRLLSALSSKGAGLPAGTVGAGVVADMNYEPSQLIDSDGKVVPGFPLPAEVITFPEPVQGEPHLRR